MKEVIQKISFYQNRRDEVPNQDLARELAKAANQEGVREIAGHLWDKNKNIQSDCLKVLYETGYINPELIAGYADDFLKLISNKNNRLVWGAMIALGTIAHLLPEKIWNRVDDIMEAVDNGSVITIDWGVRVLAKVAASNPAYREKLFPYLMNLIEKTIPRDVPRHAESLLCAVGPKEKEAFLTLLESRKKEMKPSQLTKLKKVIKQAEKIG